MIKTKIILADPAQVEVAANFAVALIRSTDKKRKLQERARSKYISLMWIPCTTCEAERLFSACRHIYSEFR